MGDSFFEGGDCRPGGDSRLIKKSTGSVGDLPGASSGKTIWIGLRLRSMGTLSMSQHKISYLLERTQTAFPQFLQFYNRRVLI